MTREEHKEKLFFLQVSEKFFSELPVRRLLHAGGGDTMLRIYLQAHCVALRTGGVLELHDGMQPAEEIALLIGSPDTEIPMVSATMQHCLAYGLISTSEGDTGKFINFSLTADYTRAWTRDAIARREKREAEKLETAEDVPAIEGKGGEEKEKKPSNRAKAQAEADAMFERLWRRYPKKKLKGRVKPAAKYRLYKEYGEEKCQRVVDMYAAEREGKDPTYTYYGCNFFNKEIFEYLDGDAGQDAQPAQAQPKAQPVTEKTVRYTIMREGIWNIRTQAWDRAKLDEIRDKIGPEMAAAIEAKMA